MRIFRGWQQDRAKTSHLLRSAGGSNDEMEEKLEFVPLDNNGAALNANFSRIRAIASNVGWRTMEQDEDAELLSRARSRVRRSMQELHASLPKPLTKPTMTATTMGSGLKKLQQLENAYYETGSSPPPAHQKTVAPAGDDDVRLSRARRDEGRGKISSHGNNRRPNKRSRRRLGTFVHNLFFFLCFFSLCAPRA